MLVNVLPFNSFINIYIFTSFEADMSAYIIGGTMTMHGIYNWRHYDNA